MSINEHQPLSRLFFPTTPKVSTLAILALAEMQQATKSGYHQRCAKDHTCQPISGALLALTKTWRASLRDCARLTNLRHSTQAHVASLGLNCSPTMTIRSHASSYPTEVTEGSGATHSGPGISWKGCTMTRGKAANLPCSRNAVTGSCAAKTQQQHKHACAHVCAA